MACELLVAACMWDLVPGPGIEPGPPALGVQNLNHCTTREVPCPCFLRFALSGLIGLNTVFLMQEHES